jgi:glycerol-3-phosphate dehydrogenase
MNSIHKLGEYPSEIFPESTELLIVGGGIHGCSIARLAAANGIQCVLLEKSDFGSGASSASSKLIHGGLRYLETYNFSLVAEAAQERAHLAKCAPHRVYDADFLFPLIPQNRHAKWMVSLGLWTYEFLAGKHLLHRHHKISKQDLIKKEPDFLSQNHLHRGAYGYSDAIGDDVRMVVECAVDAEARGALLANYHEVTRIEKQKIEGQETRYLVHFENRLTGKKSQISAKKVICTLGPTTDSQLNLWGFKPERDLTVLSQGTHLFVKKLPIEHPFILPVPQTNRYFFVIPWDEGTLIGTTERVISAEKAASPRAHADEISEIQDLFKIYFPDLELDVICTTCGVRPLASSDKKWWNLSQKSSSVEASRMHKIHAIDSHFWAMVGGKYTTHRQMSLDALKKMGFSVSQKLEDEQYPGSKDFIDSADLIRKLRAYQPALSIFVIERWAKMYGTRALEIGQNSAQLRDDDQALIAELQFTQQTEFVKTLSDFMRRRSHLFFSRDAGISLMSELTRYFYQWPHWDHTIEYLQYLESQNHVGLKNL